MSTYQDDNTEVKELLKENQRLLIENNTLLHKMRRGSIIGAIFRLLWFALIIGLLLYSYFYYIKPNWDNLTAKIQELEQTSEEIKEVKAWFDSLNLRPK